MTSPRWLAAACFVVLGCADSHGPAPVACGECGAGEACIGGTCAPDCRGTVPDLAAEIASDLRVVGSLCGALPAGPIAARASGGDVLRIVHAHLDVTADGAIVAVDRYEASLGDGILGSPVSSCATTFRPSRAGVPVALSAGMGLSPSGALAHFGIEATGNTPEGWHFEARSYVVTEDCTFHERALTRFTGSVLLSEDPDALLVLGVTDGGSGLWRGETQMVPGSAGGSVRLFGEDHVILPTSTGHGASLLQLFRASDLRGGTPPIASVAESDFDLWPRDFVVIEGRGLVGRGWTGDEHGLYPIEIADGHFPAMAPTMFASSRIAQVSSIDASTRALLQHESGLVVVE